MKCTCYIGETESLGEPILRKCNLCSAASAMLDACRFAFISIDISVNPVGAEKLKAAIKLAEEGL